MPKINALKLLIVLFVFALPISMYAQTTGNRTDLVNKTWRIVGMKCPDQTATADNDDYVHYYGTLHLTPEIYSDINHGKYMKVYRDQRDNPKEEGTYSIITDDQNETKLILKPRKGNKVEYRVALVYPNHLTLVQLDEAEKCRVSYAIAP